MLGLPGYPNPPGTPGPVATPTSDRAFEQTKMANDDDHFDPWREGKRGIKRGLFWTAAILLVAWWLW